MAGLIHCKKVTTCARHWCRQVHKDMSRQYLFSECNVWKNKTNTITFLLNYTKAFFLSFSGTVKLFPCLLVSCHSLADCHSSCESRQFLNVLIPSISLLSIQFPTLFILYFYLISPSFSPSLSKNLCMFSLIPSFLIHLLLVLFVCLVYTSRFYSIQ